MTKLQNAILQAAASSALVVTMAGGAMAAPDEGAGTKQTNTALKEEIDKLKQENQLKQELNESSKQLIESQKNLIEAQKQMTTSQKGLLDAMFPMIEGGKSGSLTIVPNSDIGPLAQSAAFNALNLVVKPVCATTKTVAPSGAIVGSDTDLQSTIQYRISVLQLDGLAIAYTAMLPRDHKGTTLQSLPPGMAIYGIGALAKELSSFLKLFWEDRTVYFSQVAVDDKSLYDAITHCMTASGDGAAIKAKTLQSAMAGLMVNPKGSYLLSSLSNLSSLRYTAELRIQQLRSNQDATATATRASLESLNSQYDALLAGMLTTGDDKKAPAIAALLSGEALATALADDYAFLSARIVQAAGVGVKSSSLWHADRLNTAATISISYRLINKAGEVVGSGVESTTPAFKRAALE